jgi:hypothetical protein
MASGSTPQCVRQLIAESCFLLVENLLRHLLLQPSDEDHRPPQVLRHPRLLGAAAATDGFLESGEDSAGDIAFLALRIERNLEIVARLEAELLELLAAEGDRFRARVDGQLVGAGAEGNQAFWGKLPAFS